MNPELRPCPFCGAATSSFLDTAGGGFLILCEVGCGAEGPAGNTLEEASSLWSRRPIEDALHAEIERVSSYAADEVSARVAAESARLNPRLERRKAVRDRLVRLSKALKLALQIQIVGCLLDAPTAGHAVATSRRFGRVTVSGRRIEQRCESLRRRGMSLIAELERLSGPPSAAESELDALRVRLGNIERAARTAAVRLHGLCPPGMPPFPSDSNDMTAQLWCIAMELGNEIEWSAEVHGEDGGES